ncbi:phosphonate transport system permease protein [Bradyrhizobium sp. USDA 3397]
MDKTGRSHDLAVGSSEHPMRTAVPEFPEARLRELADRYAAAIAAKRRRVWLGAAVLIAVAIAAGWMGEVSLGNFVENFWRFPAYFVSIAPKFSFATAWSDLADWLWGLPRWTRLLGDTLLIAYMGTLSGALCGFALCFLASANLVKSGTTVFVTRRVLEFFRTVPEIVFALIFVLAFGLGPLPGVLAIAIHTAGALGKQFAEVVENIDSKPVEGVAASGGSWVQVVRFGALPQVLSNFVSYALLRFEINVRGAAVMGFVGAGGIGQDLIEAVRKFYFTDVSAILLLIVLTVMLIDFLTERLRHRLLGLEGSTR